MTENGGPVGPPSERTRVRRKAERGRYETSVVHAILDEGFVGHVGFVAEGYPVVVPMVYARHDDVLYLHGAPGNDALRHLSHGAAICVTVTLVDGIVLARSAFHHSLNYRSVVLFGVAREVADLEERRTASGFLVEHLVQGRSTQTRAPSPAELRATRFVALVIDEASAKVRTGGPAEEPEDLELRYWAGVIPLSITPGTPRADDGIPTELEVPSYARAYSRPGWTPDRGGATP